MAKFKRLVFWLVKILDSSISTVVITEYTIFKKLSRVAAGSFWSILVFGIVNN